VGVIVVEPVGDVVTDWSPKPDARAEVVALYQDSYRELVRLGALLTGSVHAAEDLVHEAFVKLYERWDRLDDQARAGGYVRVTLVNLARGRHRRHLVAVRHQEAPPVPGASAEDSALDRVAGRDVVAALQQLPDRQRECLVLRHYLRMTEGEIASTLDIGVGSVRTHLSRGRAALERSLGGLR
jgi:RNA polymerase sigma-70 factor (sigma-E family)